MIALTSSATPQFNNKAFTSTKKYAKVAHHNDKGETMNTLFKRPVTIGLIEADQSVCNCLHNYLNQQSEFDLTLTASSVEQMKEKLLYIKMPCVMLVAMDLPNLSGIDGIRLIKQDSPNSEVMMLSRDATDEKIFSALRAGACGCLLKNTELNQVKQAIIDLHQGGAPMSPAIARAVCHHFQPKKQQSTSVKFTRREQQVVDAIVDGLAYKQIATRLSIGLETVRHHIKNIYSKLQVNSKAQVIAKVLS